MTIQELVELIKENFGDENKVIDISGMDFGDYTVNIAGLKTKKNLFQHYQKVGGMLSQSHQEVGLDLFQNNHEVGSSIYQDKQKAGISIYQEYHKAENNIYQGHLIAGNAIYQFDQKAKQVIS